MQSDLNLPYEVHTGRELELMLRGIKPLAHFYDVHPSDTPEEIIPEEAFAPHVGAGLFDKVEYVELLTHPPPAGSPHIRGTRHVFYAPTRELWRVDAYIDMQLRLAPVGWTLALERLQGRLLGYEDWQIDIHLDQWRRHATAKDFPWLFEDELHTEGDA